MPVSAAEVKRVARDCGFELAGIAAAEPSPDFAIYRDWTDRGFAGRMGYLTGHRAELRRDPRRLMASARSILCVGKVYNGPQPYSIHRSDPELGWISRYAWGQDYHPILRIGLEKLATRLKEVEAFEYRICVDTAPILERSYARAAGLGWIGRNACLINQQMGSWFFLGEMLLSLSLEVDGPPPDRCGTCRRCIEACPTQAIVHHPAQDRWEVDARLCISYFTIELRGAVPEEHRREVGSHVFGCDICQDVCPWNRRAAVTPDLALLPLNEAPPLETLAAISEQEFRDLFRPTPVERARYSGFLRNVAVAMGNSGLAKFRRPLERMAGTEDAIVAEHARWALQQL